MYIILPKVCGHLSIVHPYVIVEQLIPKLWLLICCYNRIYSSGKTRFWNLLEHWFWASRSHLQSVSLVHPQCVEWGWGQGFHAKLGVSFLYELCFVHGCIVMFGQERAFPKLLPQLDYCLNIIVCFASKISLNWNRKQTNTKVCVCICLNIVYT